MLRSACIIGVVVALMSPHTYAQGRGGSADVAAADAGVIRQVTAVLRLAANGVSEPMDFVVPPSTRSLTVVVEGDMKTLYALASLRTADGAERVNIDVNATHGASMEDSYYEEQIGTMAGDLYQNIRLGTFTAIYPYAPGQPLSAGRTSLRIGSNAVDGDVNVTVLMPVEDGSRILHINVVVASDEPARSEQPPTFLAAAQAIFAQAGIRLVVDQVRLLRGTPFNHITEWTEPQETPESELARLATEGRKVVSSDALNIYVVDELPRGVYGLSLGTPGPPVSSSYYNGVVLRQLESDDFTARVFTHEVAHFLGLQHLVEVSASGKRHVDPLPDTEPGQGNLMERTGTSITASQAFVLSRSPLLRTQ